MGVLNSADDTLLMDDENYPKEYLPVGMEHLKAYEILKASSLDWTFVGAPDLVEAEVTGIYHTTATYVPPVNNNKINTGDLAMFMLNEAERKEYNHQKVGISN